MVKTAFFLAWSFSCSLFLVAWWILTFDMNRPDLFPKAGILIPIFALLLIFNTTSTKHQRRVVKLGLQTRIERAYAPLKWLRVGTSILSGVIALPLLFLSGYYLVLGSAFTVSSAGVHEVAERLFSVISHSDRFVGDESVAVYQISKYKKLDEPALRKALISVYGSVSPQLANYDYRLGVLHAELNDFKSADTLFSESIHISALSNDYAARRRKLQALSQLAMVKARLDQKNAAIELIHDTLKIAANWKGETKLAVVTNLFDSAASLNDPNLSTYIWHMKESTEAELTNAKSENTYPDDVSTLALMGTALFLLYVTSSVSGYCLLSFFKNREFKSLKTAPNGVKPLIYNDLIDLELYLGKLEQANAHSICLLHTVNHYFGVSPK